ncbi:acyl-CoA thioesterase [Pacificimonas flava]|uniref:4-hydroxybenzoyl-CoA thioesterase n=1 Tax=Pacificimonas flava TaxID=1234595 RepID=M2U694_9SPHN|nr:thioesterase family protein [Pacificimonas flava]EMD83547.1 4-hydroxybenzoyl-CoA thioesterase [Pacificimonas flava]MBB5278902.1 acyl-CoA thioester hydrolase [Pacificimonas flava]
MARSDFRFAHRLRVRYAEIDAQAIVFNTRYLEYFDVGITEYFRATGRRDLTQPDGGGAEFHVARNTIDYKKPLVLDEEFDICLRCQRIGSSSMTYEWEIHGLANGEGKDDLRALGTSVSVHVGEVGKGPTPVPDGIVLVFETFEGRALRNKEKTA